MINAARGEAALTLDGRPRRLCLTLGALAELETAFGLDGLDALGARLGALSPDDLLAVLRALLGGGGEAAPAGDLDASSLDWAAAARAAAECFRRAFEEPGAEWSARLRLGARLGAGPRDFWALSVREWRALTAELQGAPGMDRAAFALLSKHYPDGEHD